MYVIDDYDVPGPTGRSVRIAWRGTPPVLKEALVLLPLLVVSVAFQVGAERKGPIPILCRVGWGRRMRRSRTRGG